VLPQAARKGGRGEGVAVEEERMIRNDDIPQYPPKRPAESHRHRWQSVGVVQMPNGQRSVLGETVPALAQSCECGEVRAVILRLR
jgi:hypothetical protein